MTNNLNSQIVKCPLDYIGRPGYRKSLHPSKEKIQHFNTIHFSLFLQAIFANLDPDQADQNQGGITRILTRIHNTT